MVSMKKLVSNLFPVALIGALMACLPHAALAQNSGKSDPRSQSKTAAADRVPDSKEAHPLASEYIIGAGDVLSINVWRETEISQKLVVRPDGMITLPLVGDIMATGQTPEQLAGVVTKKLESILTNPQVSVIVAEVHSKFYVVVGQVAKPGQYPLTHPTTVIEAVSQAGGFRDFAKSSKMYILREQNGKRTRIPFNYNRIVKAKDPGQDVEVSSGDEIVVP
jgi:polysaccharide biosynthesis/export protein